MSRFRKTEAREVPSLNTASLPDLIFTLLFFFMIVTNLREVDLKVQYKVPDATELQKLENKSLVTYIYVGKPEKQYQEEVGTNVCIQINDVLVSLADIPVYLEMERARLRPDDKDKMVVSLKIDKDVKMGLVRDIKEMLRESSVLTVHYVAIKSEN